MPHRQAMYTWQAAKVCGLSERSIRAAASSGRLRGFRLPDTPKLWRFWRDDVEIYNLDRSVKVRQIVHDIGENKPNIPLERFHVAEGI